MCKYCDYNSPDNRIYIDSLTNKYYLDIEISELDEYDDGFVYQREYISYCPWCGRKLEEKKAVQKEKWVQLFENENVILEQRDNKYYLFLYDKGGKFQREVIINIEDNYKVELTNNK